MFGSSNNICFVQICVRISDSVPQLLSAVMFDVIMLSVLLIEDKIVVCATKINSL